MAEAAAALEALDEAQQFLDKVNQDKTMYRDRAAVATRNAIRHTGAALKYLEEHSTHK